MAQKRLSTLPLASFLLVECTPPGEGGRGHFVRGPGIRAGAKPEAELEFGASATALVESFQQFVDEAQGDPARRLQGMMWE